MAENCEFVGMTLPFVGDYAAYRHCQAGGSNDDGGDSSMDIGELIYYVTIIEGTTIGDIINLETGLINNVFIGDIPILKSNDSVCNQIAKNSTIEFIINLVENSIKFYAIECENISEEDFEATVSSIEEIDVEYTYSDGILKFTIPDIESEFFGISYQEDEI